MKLAECAAIEKTTQELRETVFIGFVRRQPTRLLLALAR